MGEALILLQKGSSIARLCRPCLRLVHHEVGCDDLESNLGAILR